MSVWWSVPGYDPGSGGGDPDPPPPEDPSDPGPNAGPRDEPEEPYTPPAPTTTRVRVYEWRAAWGNTCPLCASLDGNRYEDDDGPWPPLHLGCRCARVLVAVEERTDYRRRADWEYLPPTTRRWW